jgi:phosphoglycolate phosphatase-like HAD superfamily hydrolase
MNSSKTSKWLRWGLTIGLSAVLALPAMAQEDALKAFPGYVDFGELNSIFGEPKVQISIGESLLGLVGTLSEEEDPEAAELFRKLNGVRVNVYETEAMADGAVDRVKDISDKLSSSGWESVITVNSADEQVRVFMKLNGETVDGIAVMALEDDEAVFVNVIGNINPTELERVMKNFDVDIDQ